MYQAGEDDVRPCRAVVQRVSACGCRRARQLGHTPWELVAPGVEPDQCCAAHMGWAQAAPSAQWVHVQPQKSVWAQQLGLAA
jgi:hypothetical protein